MVAQESIEHVQQLYIKPEHPIFDLIPHSLNILIEDCYIQLGSPAIECRTVWMIYLNLLTLVQQHQDVVHAVAEVMDAGAEDQNSNVPLIGGLCNLIENDNYMGGLGNGMGWHELN